MKPTSTHLNSCCVQVCRETTELAYDSLGTEITQDEEERTQLYAYQAAMGVAGVLFVAGGNAAFSALLHQETSFKILGLSIGVGGTISNLFMVWYIKENPAFAEQGTMPLIPGFRSCFANRPYMMCVPLASPPPPFSLNQAQLPQSCLLHRCPTLFRNFA